MNGVDIRTAADILIHENLRPSLNCCHLSSQQENSAVQVLHMTGHDPVTERVFGGVATSKKPGK
jgi:hypothetical protein